MTHDLWLQIFAYTVYAIALVVLWVTYRKDGLFYAAMPLVFVLYFLISELLATQGGLPYKYGNLPHCVCIEMFGIDPGGWFQWLAQFLFGTPPPGMQAQAEAAAQALAGAGAQAQGFQPCLKVPACVPIAVPIMEGFTLFSLLRTSMVLQAPKWLQPFMVALLATMVDWILDPTSAVSQWCGEVGDGMDIYAAGIEFWRWFVWGHYKPNWHGIPLINFGAWFFGSVGIAAAAGMVTWVRTFFVPSLINDILSILATLLFVLISGLLLEMAAFRSMGLIFETAGEAGQWAFVIGWATATAAIVLSLANGFQRGQPLSWEWLPMPAILMITSLAGLILAGPHSLLELLWVAWGVILVLLATYLYWPSRA